MVSVEREKGPGSDSGRLRISECLAKGGRRSLRSSPSPSLGVLRGGLSSQEIAHAYFSEQVARMSGISFQFAA
jgi:hypothetical protein